METIFRAAKILGSPGCEEVQVLMLVGLRENEVARAEWKEFEGQDWIGPDPHERPRDKIPQAVGSPRSADHRCARGRCARHLNSDYVFSVNGRKPFAGFSQLKEKLEKALADKGSPSWRWHDFRRALATWAQERRNSTQ
jgi:hypothetical protein